MKKNFPVTQVEHKVKEGEELVSSTDLKGAVSYANQAFCDIAQFTLDELEGKNHNMVRHPDMPPEAFADLWSNLKAKKFWRGVIKNRCKNGDYYWVDAFVMPVFENNKVCAYESVRTKPSEGQISRAKKLYEKLNQNKSLPEKPIVDLSLTQKYLLISLLSFLPAAIAVGLGATATWLIISLTAGLLVSFGLSYWMSQGLRHVVKKAESIVDNPITQYLYTGGYGDSHKIMTAIGMLETLNNTLLGRLKEASKVVEEKVIASHESVEKVHQQIGEQEAELEQLASAMTEMHAAIQEIANNTNSASVTAEAGTQSVNQGKQAAETAVEDITRLVSDIDKVNDALGNLKGAVDGISNMVQVINDIAEQTNMLALNAAIEAARAGDQGRGFAVVADEVRTLASRTQSSTTEIQAQIEQLQQSSQQAFEAMSKGKENAQQNLTNTTELENSLKAVIVAVNDIQKSNTSTATAAEEQSATTEEINRNVTAISDKASQTLSEADNLKAQGDDLRKFSNELMDLVQRFRIG